MVSENKDILNENSVVLISGGAKGITAKCAIKIAETAQCRFLLIGRSSRLASEPDWAGGIENSKELQKSALAFYKKIEKKITPKILQKEIKNILSSREISTTINEIESHGGTAVYIAADVTDQKLLISQVHSAVKKLGPVTGVIHGAGNLADKLIENKSADDFDLVVNTKINGLKNIIQSLNPEALKFLVLFSSVAGFFGNTGQTDYAIANEILNKSAHMIQKSLPNCRVISINWGPWDSGMVSPELKKVFKERNIQLISTEFGVETLIKELVRPNQKTSQILVGSSINTHVEINPHHKDEIIVHRYLDQKNNPFLNDHQIGSQAVLPATCASAWLADTCESLNPGFSFFHMEDFKVLKGATFNNDRRLYEIALKSLSDTNGTIKKYDVVITSQNDKNHKVFHYSGQVTLVKELPVVPKHQLVGEFELDTSQHRAGSDFYQDGTLFHGPFLQGIQDVLQLNESRVITRISLPQMAVVQSLLIWTQEFYDAPCLPSRLHQWDNYRVIPFGMPAWVNLNITYHNEHAVVGDILVQDEQGNEFFSFTGLEGTISKHLKRFIGRKVS